MKNYGDGFIKYFREFLMLFFAVTLSFFAQGIRENIDAKDNANEFLQSYKNELLEQKLQFLKFEQIFKTKLTTCDTIINIYHEQMENKKLQTLRALIIPAKTIIDLPIITSSYDQMVNSGSLRYIKNPPLREKMAYYKYKIEDIQNFNNHIIQTLLNMASEVGEIEDLHDFVSVNSNFQFDKNYIPKMDSFKTITNEQRRLAINYYVGYKVQAVSNLGALGELTKEDDELVSSVSKELSK